MHVDLIIEFEFNVFADAGNSREGFNIHFVTVAPGEVCIVPGPFIYFFFTVDICICLLDLVIFEKV
jgi:hypothetical protein